MRQMMLKHVTPEAAELEQINRYTRRPFSAQEIYTFSVVLCDNRVDRDDECFTTPALETLAALFVGKTGILDHEHSSRNQTARIYAAAVEYPAGETNDFGEPYARLVARAYIPRQPETEGFIRSLESGIRKEVSIGCAVRKKHCSVCGQEHCSHIRGRLYNGNRCVRMLSEPTDAYEFSFVAVPAQKAAGVIKSFDTQMKQEGESMTEWMEKLKSAETVTLSAGQVNELQQTLQALEHRAQWGDRYREKLCGRIVKLSAVAQPQLGRSLLQEMTAALSVERLEEMEQALSEMAQSRLPLAVQLSAGKTDRKEPDDGAFCI